MLWFAKTRTFIAANISWSTVHAFINTIQGNFLKLICGLVCQLITLLSHAVKSLNHDNKATQPWWLCRVSTFFMDLWHSATMETLTAPVNSLDNLIENQLWSLLPISDINVWVNWYCHGELWSYSDPVRFQGHTCLSRSSYHDWHSSGPIFLDIYFGKGWVHTWRKKCPFMFLYDLIERHLVVYS